MGGAGTASVKTEVLCRSQQLSKYRKVLVIYGELGDAAVYAGTSFLTSREI